MNDTIAIVIIRATSVHGQHIEADSVLNLPALAAQALVANGKAKLKSEADAGALQAAVRAADFQIARNTPGYVPSIQTLPR